MAFSMSFILLILRLREKVRNTNPIIMPHERISIYLLKKHGFRIG